MFKLALIVLLAVVALLLWFIWDRLSAIAIHLRTLVLMADERSKLR